MTNKALIIPAAGSGTRMQKEIPKPYLKLEGRSILERTICRFLSLQGLDQIIVATSGPYLVKTQKLLDRILPDSLAGKVVKGGDKRQSSIRNALRKINGAELVLVHDAVRPFVQIKHVEECCEAAVEVGAAVLGIPSQDTVKHVDHQQFVQKTPPRAQMWQTQTPQVFQKSVLFEAYEEAERDNFIGTDDASLVEHIGHPVKMIESDRRNVKLTYPLDLELAKVFINQEKY